MDGNLLMNDDPKYIFQLGELFERVQMENIFPDSKTFVDCIPKKSLAYIRDCYEKEKSTEEFDLGKFVHQHFDTPLSSHTDFVTIKNIPLTEHINNLWDVLTRKTTETNNSLISLPKPYVVPGGRFREMFYWDSYFTMLGLQISKRYDLIKDMIDNFTYLINKYGYIPNGNRTYFLGRSQPPFYALMLQLADEESYLKDHAEPLKKEYDFWMKEKDSLNEQTRSIHHVAWLPDGSIMNRYWDENNTPRPEAFRKDTQWAKEVEDKKSFFRNDRAACESGWDFSSRWLEDGKNISTMRAANLVSVDLNSLLYYMEKTISSIAKNVGDDSTHHQVADASEKRKQAIDRYCWNKQSGCFFDYDFVKQEQSHEITIATAFPLFVKMCSQQQADLIAKLLEDRFLVSGGFLTTLKKTGQQWDAPNGWAPLQWVAIKGLLNYGHKDLAIEAAKRWTKTNEIIFEQTGKMKEKYNVERSEGDAEAGTYPTQDGFGWTNGVYLACKKIMDEQ